MTEKQIQSRFLIATAFVFAGVQTAACTPANPLGVDFSCPVPTSPAMQHDFDIARLNDLVYLGSLLEEYRAATGAYPFAVDSSVPTYIHIATREQQESITGGPPYEHRVKDVTELSAELERVLDRSVEMPFDPQRVPDSKPNFYIYMVADGFYYLAVHLHEAFPFSQRVAECYYKVELTNYPRPPAGAWNLMELMTDGDFASAIARTANNPGYVEGLRTQIREDGAF